MNVFKKISSNILATERKKTSVQIPESAQKLDAKRENCFVLVDYEIRGDGLLVCKISKDRSRIGSIGSKKPSSETKNCMVKQKMEVKDMWIGKEYCFVDLAYLTESENGAFDAFGEIDCVAQKMFVVEGIKQQSNAYKSKRN